MVMDSSRDAWSARDLAQRCTVVILVLHPARQVGLGRAAQGLL